MRQYGAVFLAASVVAATAAGQDAITVRDYEYRAGDRTRESVEEKSASTTVIDTQGRKQEKTEKKVRTVVHVDEVLTAGPAGKRPLKIRRTYEKAVEVADGAETNLALDGKVVLIEKVGGAYAFTFDGGGALAGPALAELDRKFNKRADVDSAKNDFFPDRPLKPGETWDMKDKVVKDIGNETPFSIDRDRTTATGELKSVTTRAGRRYATTEMRADVPVTTLKGRTPLKTSDGSKVTMRVDAEGCVDGTAPDVTVKLTMTFHIDAKVPGGGIIIDATSDSTMTTVPLPRK